MQNNVSPTISDVELPVSVCYLGQEAPRGINIVVDDDIGFLFFGCEWESWFLFYFCVSSKAGFPYGNQVGAIPVRILGIAPVQRTEVKEEAICLMKPLAGREVGEGHPSGLEMALTFLR